MGAWYDKRTATEVVNMRLWQQLKVSWAHLVELTDSSVVNTIVCFSSVGSTTRVNNFHILYAMNMIPLLVNSLPHSASSHIVSTCQSINWDSPYICMGMPSIKMHTTITSGCKQRPTG